MGDAIPTRTLLLVAALAGCTPVPAPVDAGSDGPRPDAPRPPDVGLDPAALSPCALDPGLGADLAPLAAYTPLTADPYLDRLFYPLVVLDEAGGALDLGAIAVERATRLETARACAGDDACLGAALGWTEAEAARAADAVAASLATSGARTAVAAHLRGSGACARWHAMPDDALVRACVADVLVAGTVALGAPVLAELDPTQAGALVEEVAALGPLPAWGALAATVARGLTRAGRDEAVRYEPLAVAENAAAVAHLATVDFAAFPFSAIVVPGQGPTEPETALHPNGRLRAELALERWTAGLAPVVLVSGGHVHPDRTRFSEAIEMRRYLVEERGMPAEAVLVDPYARHTTTNLRNATRILARAGVPGDRPILVTTDVLQATYVRSPAFEARCEDELGYRPYLALAPLSDLDACILPSPVSMHVDARDPLDP